MIVATISVGNTYLDGNGMVLDLVNVDKRQKSNFHFKQTRTWAAKPILVSETYTLRVGVVQYPSLSIYGHQSHT